MAYDPGAIEAALSAALGDDAALVRELRAAFLGSANALVDGLDRATLAIEWQRAALRLKGLAASFGALDLMRAADTAGTVEPGDVATLRRIRRLVAALDR